MTQQEFVKKESDKFEPPFMEHPIDMFQSGLTKGIEIAEKALKFARENAVNGNDGCWDFNPHDQILQSLTDSELLEIYLTENEKK